MPGFCIPMQETSEMHHIAIIVSPLRALMFDQVSQAREKGIAAVAISRKDEMSQDDIQGEGIGKCCCCGV